jgi:hypothetical protein
MDVVFWLDINHMSFSGLSIPADVNYSMLVTIHRRLL